MDHDLITVPEAEQRFGVSRTVINHLHKLGKLTLHKRVGERANLVSVSEAEAAIAQRQTRGWPKGRPRKRTPSGDGTAAEAER